MSSDTKELVKKELVKKELVVRITGYLSGGGLFNPELAIHDRVRDLLIDCRTALTPPAEVEFPNGYKIGDKVWVKDTVKGLARSEPSVLTENGVWVNSDKIRRAASEPAACQRCGLGIDHDGDGNCGVCAKWSDAEVLVATKIEYCPKCSHKIWDCHCVATEPAPAREWNPYIDACLCCGVGCNRCCART